MEEELRGLRAALENVVAPEVGAPYPSDVLATVVGALERLERGWSMVPVALRAESTELDELLGAARAVVAPATGASIATALAAPAPDWLDPAAARAHYVTRRALLAEVVRELGPGGGSAPELWARVVAHLRTHLAGPL
jgi:hypothetical protein